MSLTRPFTKKNALNWIHSSDSAAAHLGSSKTRIKVKLSQFCLKLSLSVNSKIKKLPLMEGPFRLKQKNYKLFSTKFTVN